MKYNESFFKRNGSEGQTKKTELISFYKNCTADHISRNYRAQYFESYFQRFNVIKLDSSRT